MNSGIPLLPVYLVDFLGSLLMIVSALATLYYARRLTRLDNENVLWTYIFWLSAALVAFSLSRSVGHVLRYLLILTDNYGLWRELAPISGGLNSLIFSAVATLTIFYYSMHGVIKRIRTDTESLAHAHGQLKRTHRELRDLNLTLEQRVERRTRQLRLSEEKFRGLFESSRDMILFCDADGLISDINQSGIEILGFANKAEVINTALAVYFVDEEKWSRFYCALGAQGHTKEFEVEFLHRDGSRRYLMITASTMLDDKQQRKGFELIAKDLTHFKEITDQLIHSESMASVGQLAAGVAHEINTPLGIILGYSQLLKEDFEDNPEVHELLAVVEKQAKTCKRIVRDLLKFSRHNVDGVQSPTDINTCVEEVLVIVDHTLSMDHIYLKRFLADSIPEIILDPERLRQVLINMINNAHHAIGNDGTVGVWTRFNDHCREAEILVGDTGRGIPAEILNRIFDPFFTTKGVGKGTGLGLSVSFGIIKDLGGYIDVHSPPLDQELLDAGMKTAFRVVLPVEGRSPAQEVTS